jgi:uncharacterized protein YndB with AHSA1/START domain
MAAPHPDLIPIDGVTIVREFDAPMDAVFDALTAELDAHTFVTVDRPTSFVIALDDVGYLTVLLEDLAGRTRMTFHQGGGGLSPEALEQAKAGWQAFFDVLDTLLRDAQLD